MSGSQPLADLAAAHGVRHLQVGGSACELLEASEPDIVLNAIVGFAGVEATLWALERGRHARAREQGEPGRGRRAGGRRPPPRRRPAAPGRQRAFGALPVPRRTSAGDGRVARAHGLGWAVPRPVARRARARHDRRRPRPSDLVDGTEDHRRLRHARQQGARADRGALAVRDPVRADRGRRASRVDRALARPLPRRRAARPSGPARTCGCRSRSRSPTRSGEPSRPSRSTSPPGSISGSRRPTARRSRCCRSRARPESAAGPSLAPTTPRTRLRWRRSSTGRIGFPEIADTVAAALEHVDGAPARDLDDLVAADAEARRVAERGLVPA